MMFSLFSSAVTTVTFYEGGDLEQTRIEEFGAKTA